MFHPFLFLLLVAALCGRLVQPAQAEPVDSLAVEAEPVDSSAVKAEPVDSLAVESPVIRVAKKLGAGVLGGSFGVLVVFIIGENSDPDPDPAPIAAVAAGPDIALLGYTFGSPIGVSWVDSRDKGILTWAGSMAGWFVGRMALERDTSWPFAPLIGATIASELWRKPPQSRRVSFGLSPTSNGGLSASATLHF